MVAACGTAVSFTLAYISVNRFWLSKNAAEEKPAATVAAPAPFGPPAAPGISEKFVAILPFSDLSGKAVSRDRQKRVGKRRLADRSW
jgi:hypothetical protein